MAESRRKLPCLCGKKRVVTWVRAKEFGCYQYSVVCPKCGLSTKEEYPSEIAAIRAWNELVANTLAKAITEYKEET